MGDHLCGKAPPSPKAAPASLTNPFTLRQLNAAGSKPAQPSPLQFDSPPPQARARAPTVGSTSNHISAPKPSRTAPPRINPDAANKPFLGPPPRSDSPVSPATSSRSGSSIGSKQLPPLRSMTSPMPRLWDSRPPSPELPVNLDCAFPPFPTGPNSSSRPSTSSGRKTPTGSEHGSSRSTSRQDGRLPIDNPNMEPKSPIGNVGENLFSRINTLKSGPFDPSQRRPSNDERSQQEPKPLDRRRPSLPGTAMPEAAPPLPSTVFSKAAQTPRPSTAKSVPTPTPDPLSSVAKTAEPRPGDKKVPPERPARPTDSLTPSLIDKMTAGPGPSLPPAPLQSTNRSGTFPITQNASHKSANPHDLYKVPSEPALRNIGRRPTLSSASRSEPSQVSPSHTSTEPK